jgi:hypothetical protein
VVSITQNKVVKTRSHRPAVGQQATGSRASLTYNIGCAASAAKLKACVKYRDVGACVAFFSNVRDLRSPNALWIRLESVEYKGWLDLRVALVWLL